MNQRERILQTLLFQNPERTAFAPGHGRRSTLEAWYSQGLPRDTWNIELFAYERAGGKVLLEPANAGAVAQGFTVSQKMIPEFEEKIIEQKENSRIVQDWKGNICEIGNEFGLEHLRKAIDFCTRRWIKCPVESRNDWEDMKGRYNANDPARFPRNMSEISKAAKERDWFMEVQFNGPFWQLREWLGFENLCMMLHDDPDFIREMIVFWEEFVSRLLEKTLEHVVPDSIYISEDMAYKCFSMISPAMTREFLLPTWKRWGDLVKQAGVPVYAMDSDGFVGELIPLWIEAGINVCDPVEVAAGNDINAFRKEFGQKMAFRGGVDKRAIAKGGQTIVDEIGRILPVIKSGGYMPSCDHGVPADVSWPNYVRYTGLLAKACGWM